MRTTTRQSYIERIEEAVNHAVANLSDSEEAASLARIAGFSPFHFCRLFSGIMGESPGEFLRRLRLERAAYRLQTTRQSVFDLALEAGYDNPESFARAFRNEFLYTPSEYRSVILSHRLPSPNGVHFDPEGRTPTIRPRAQGGEIMNIVIVENAPSYHTVCIRHIGPYWQIGATFGKLMAWMGQNQVPLLGKTLAVYYDDPSTRPEGDLRSDACAVVTDGYLSQDPDVRVLDIPGGRYAVYTHKGSYSGLGDAWNRFSKGLAEMKVEADPSRPCFEIYLCDCSEVSEDNLLTEIYEPIL